MEEESTKNNIVQVKSREFALKIIDTFKILKSRGEYILSKQILRSGTSIGVNIEEAVGSHSRGDFSYKITIAYREARETRYWLGLLCYGKYLDEACFRALNDECNELCRILGKIQLTLKCSKDLVSHC